jgi:hypothetical protein
MFATIVCAALTADPVADVQRRYPVHRVTVTSTAGPVVYYALPADAPPELRWAYKALEVAEREVLLSEALQLLELEYIQNERRLEALRTAYAVWYLQSPNTRGPQFYGFVPFTAPESAMKWAVTENLLRGGTTHRALAALDLLAWAQFQLRQVLEALAHPNRPRPAPVPGAGPPPKGGGAAGPPAPVRPVPPAIAREEWGAARWRWQPDRDTPPAAWPAVTPMPPAAGPPAPTSWPHPVAAPLPPYPTLAPPLSIPRLNLDRRSR